MGEAWRVPGVAEESHAHSPSARRSPDGGVEGQLLDNGPVPYGETPEGRWDLLYELFAGLKVRQDGAVVGALYRDPVMIPAGGGGWQVGGDTWSAAPPCSTSRAGHCPRSRPSPATDRTAGASRPPRCPSVPAAPTGRGRLPGVAT